MDAMFDAIDQSKEKNDKDDDYVASSDSSSDVSNSESIEKNSFEENGSQMLLGRQFCRLEAKIDQLHLLVVQIQRASIANLTSSTLELDRIPELPLTSEEMLNKFEFDLSQDSYRQKIVSVQEMLFLYYLIEV